MEIRDAIERAKRGELRPTYVLVGPERFLLERAVRAIRAAAVGDGPTGFNEDAFHGGQGLSAKSILSAAKTLPMMAATRFVLVRDTEALPAAELDALASYLEEPSPSTCLVLVAEKLDGRTRFAKAARKVDAWIEAPVLKAAAARSFITDEASARGHRIAGPAAEALLDAIGEDLALLDDGLERLSLFVGEGAPIDEAAIEACIQPVRSATIWALVDAVSLRDLRPATRAAASLLAAREPALRILAMIARQLRMVARMQEALSTGLRPPEAAKAAGAPPFKARELAEAARRFRPSDLAAAFVLLAETDRALKGSKRPPEVILEEAILRLCRATPGSEDRRASA